MAKRSATTADSFTPEELEEMNKPPSPERVIESRRSILEWCEANAPDMVGEAKILLEKVS